VSVVIRLFITFVGVTIFLLIFFAVAIPLFIDINTHLYLAGEKILNDTQFDIQQIKDEEIRKSLERSIEEAKSSVKNQIETLTWFFMFSWLFILMTVGLVFYVVARKTKEVFE